MPDSNSPGRNFLLVAQPAFCHQLRQGLTRLDDVAVQIACLESSVMTSARDEVTDAHTEPHQDSYVATLSATGGGDARMDMAPAIAELNSLRAELEDAIRENLERRQAIRALDREVMQLRSMLAEAERQMGNIRQTFIYRIGETIVSARTLKGLRQLPRRLIALRRAYLEKRGLTEGAGRSYSAISDRMRYVDEAVRIHQSQGLEAAVNYLRTVPVGEMAAKARALLELAHAVYPQDPARAASLAVDAGSLNPSDPRLRALVLALYDHGEVDAPALILSALNDVLADTPVDRLRRETILAQERQLASPLRFPEPEVRAAGPVQIAVVASRSLPHHLEADAFRAQAVMDAARASGLNAWLVTPPGYQYPASGDGSVVNRILGATPMLRLPPAGPAPGAFESYVKEVGSLLADEFKRHNITCVHALADPVLNAAACWAARTIGSRFILDIGEIPSFGSEIGHTWQRTERFRSGLSLFAELIRNSDRTIVRSRALASALTELGIQMDSIVVDDSVPSAISRVPEIEIDGVRQQLGVGDQKIIGVYESQDGDEGFYDFLEAFDIVRRSEPNTLILLLGTGRGAEALRQRAAIRGVAEQILMPADAARRNIAGHLSICEVLVFPKRRPFAPGLAASFELQTALAIGAPVVAADTAWSREWVVEGVSGLLVRPGDAHALAEAILRILRSANIRDALKQGGHDLVHGRSGATVIYPLLASIFQGTEPRAAA